MSALRLILSFVALLVTALCATLAQSIPNGVILYNNYDYSSGQPLAQLWAINPDGSGDTRIPVNLPEPGFPVWAKDRQLLALTSADPAKQFALSRDVFVFDPLSQQLLKLTSFPNSWQSAATNAGTLGQIEFDGASLTLPWYKAFSPDKRRLAIAGNVVSSARLSVPQQGAGDFTLISGTQSSGTQSTPTLWVYGLDGAMQAQVAAGAAGASDIHAGDGVDWAPNQDLLVWPKDITIPFSGFGNPRQVTALFVLEPVNDALISGHGRQLTFPQGSRGDSPGGPYTGWATDFQPAFSPNGQQVAYIRSSNLVVGAIVQLATPSLRLVNVDGSNDHEIFSFQPGDYVAHVAWSPDGANLAFDFGKQMLDSKGFPLMLADPSTVALYTIGADGKDATILRKPAAAWPVWSPGQASPVNQVPQAPQLTVSLLPGQNPRQLIISWPASATNLVLETAIDLPPTRAWQAFTNAPAVSQGQASVTVGPTADHQFFRLRQY
jgi:hypothetical protein